MITPKFLKNGDKVCIVAPSGRIQKDDLYGATKLLSNWGLKVFTGNHVHDNFGFFSSTDRGRLEDLQQALDDHTIRAIFCARGGYGIGRILDDLNFERFTSYPKWIVGFSDITLLHMKLHTQGCVSIHGPVARQLGTRVDQQSAEFLKKILFNESPFEYHIPPNESNVEGAAHGQLVGGNLTLICNNLGTDSSFDFAGKILFIEDVGEAIYAIDRNFNQLQRAGLLNNLMGMVVGQFSKIRDTQPPYHQPLQDIILEYAKDLGYPVCFGLPSGHEKTNVSLPVSHKISLNVSSSGVTINFAFE